MDAGEDMLVMRSQELERYQIIRKVFDNQINQQEAAEYLDLSDRQIRRIVRRVRSEGPRGVIHKLRGSVGCRRLEESFKNKILGLYKQHYHDFGPTLASEKLLERHKIRVNNETLRLWLIKEALWQTKKLKNQKERTWRPRKDHLGEMTQMDGSHHDWLEGRGPKLALMGYIDDATGKFFGEFFAYEGTFPAMESLKSYIHRYGLPKSIYLDKHSTYKNNQKQTYKDWPFHDKEELTQFGRACRQLGIHLIYANSPQAKGRVERVFETLQDRLVKELRLANARTCRQANKILWRYLGSFNQKFEVAAKRKGDLHRPLNKSINLEDILSVQTTHALRNDRTVIHNKGLYQVLAKTRTQQVMVHEYPDGHMIIKHGMNPLPYKRINVRPKKKEVKKLKIRKPRFRYVPPKGSYYRDAFRLPGSRGGLKIKLGHF
jgi:hypothetical protein